MKFDVRRFGVLGSWPGLVFFTCFILIELFLSFSLQRCFHDFFWRRARKKTEKELLTERGLPYVAIVSMDIDPENIHQGSFELDWNDKFVANLVRFPFCLGCSHALLCLTNLCDRGRVLNSKRFQDHWLLLAGILCDIWLFGASNGHNGGDSIYCLYLCGLLAIYSIQRRVAQR